MSGDPRIVDGGDVKFDQSTAQADVLVPAQEPVAETSPIASDLGKIVADYVENMVELKSGSNNFLFGVVRDVSMSLYPEVFPYLRFNDKMDVCSLPVPRDVYVTLFSREYPLIGELLRETNLGESFPQGDIDLYATFPNSILNFGATERQLNIVRELNNGKTVTTQGAYIPGVPFLKLLFPKDSRTIAYLDHLAKNKDEFKNLSTGYVVSKSSGTDFYQAELPSVRIFHDTRQLLAFVKETGQKEITSILNEYTSLVYEINLPIQNKNTDQLRAAIYNRIKQYHPELTV